MPQIPFILWLKNNKLSYKTIKEYERYNRIFFENNTGLISQELVNHFLESNNNIVSRAFVKNLKEYTLQNYQDELTPDQLAKIYRISFGKMHIKDKPTKVKDIISREEVHELERVIPNELGKIMLLINYYCALRVSELFLIKAKDFNFSKWELNPESNGLVTIHGKGGTIENVLVPPELMKRIESYITEKLIKNPDDPIKRDYLFNTTIRELSDNINKNERYEWEILENRYLIGNYAVWNRLLKRASKRVLKRDISTHILRRSFATFLLNNGWDLIEVKEHLRHKDLNTTQMYTQIDKTRLSKKFTEILKQNQ